MYGVTGSGKTTLASQLAGATSIPWYSVDDLTWEPGWEPVEPDEQRRRIARICADDEWILDTAYGAWLEIPLARAQCIVGLDYPRWFSLQRLLRRTLARVVDRRTICNGNQESVRDMISRDSILAWHFRSFARKRGRIRAWTVDPSAPPVVRLTSGRQTAGWLTRVAGPAEPAA